jgi:hypothetical protein
MVETGGGHAVGTPLRRFSVLRSARGGEVRARLSRLLSPHRPITAGGSGGLVDLSAVDLGPRRLALARTGTRHQSRLWRDDRWVTDRASSKDSVVARADYDTYDRLIRHTCRVLLTRGVLGTVIYATDSQTRVKLRQLLSKQPGTGRTAGTESCRHRAGQLRDRHSELFALLSVPTARNKRNRTRIGCVPQSGI